MTEKVVDLAKVRSKRAELQNTAARVKSGKDKLTRGELSDAFTRASELVDEQYQLLQAMASDILKLANGYSEMQDHAAMIAAQTFLALEMMKEKGLCTSEELQTKWETVVREKITEAGLNEPKIVEPKAPRIIIP